MAEIELAVPSGHFHCVDFAVCDSNHITLHSSIGIAIQIYPVNAIKGEGILIRGAMSEEVSVADQSIGILDAPPALTIWNSALHRITVDKTPVTIPLQGIISTHILTRTLHSSMKITRAQLSSPTVTQMLSTEMDTSTRYRIHP